MNPKMFLMVALISLALLTGLTGLVARGASPSEVREIEILAKDMTFNGDNPTIKVHLGDTVHLTVKNEDWPRMAHDLVITGLPVKTEVMQPGQSVKLTFVAERAGVFTYLCTLHPRMMTGKFIVEE